MEVQLCEHEVMQCVDCKKAIRTDEFQRKFQKQGRDKLLHEQKLFNGQMCGFLGCSKLATFHMYLCEEHESADNRVRDAIQKGRLLMVSDLMNRHKTPFNIKIFPEEVTISSEKMLSLSNSLVDIYADNFARKLQKAYKERREHRRTCPKWSNHEMCIECGFGLTQFLIDALGEDWEFKMQYDKGEEEL